MKALKRLTSGAIRLFFLGAVFCTHGANPDTTPPVVKTPGGVTAVAPGYDCDRAVQFQVTATDNVGVTWVQTVPPSGTRFPLGVTTVTATAADAAGNIATNRFTVTVRRPVRLSSPCGETITRASDPGSWGAVVDFPAPVIDDPCLTADVVTEPPPGSFFPVGKTEVTSRATLPWGEEVVCTFTVEVTAPDNIVWPRALEVALAGDLGILQGTSVQALTQFDESRWYKFQIQPGSRVVATLTGLPANYDLVLFKDIGKAYTSLTSPADLSLLDAQFADDAFSPAQFSPAQFSPAQFSPAAFSPAQFSPAQFSPAQFSPAQFSPAQFSPAQFSPDAFAPAQFSPAQFSPAQFSPAQFSPAQFSPAQFSPAQFSEAAYASAQVRSVIAVSAFDGTAGEGVVANTWDEDTDFYLRVRGRQGVFDPEQTYRVDVYLIPGVCDGVSPVPVNSQGEPQPDSATAAPAGNFRTLILTDYDRLTGPGDSPARTELTAKLAELAARPEVQGYVLDVATDPWVSFFNDQADQHFDCPYAKNLVAEAIRGIVQRSRTGNALEYLVLVGNDSVLPFFRHPDEALLGPEQDYIPPVFEFSASQASLRRNYFLTQDRYGALCDVPRKNTRLPLPDLAVGRLLETPGEIMGMIDEYLSHPGGLLPAPASVLVTGYDFLEDVANSVAAEWTAGTGLAPDRLIAPRELAPGDPDTWTASDLRTALLGSRHDVLFLAGHFSAVGTLAADYTSRFLASELADSSVDLAGSILYSAGCHSGYNIVDPDAIPGITLEPDWAQVCARKRITLLAGTGYQYGDTDFIEYSERLYLEFTRRLRTGTGPVSLGRALVQAKQQYLASTPTLKGIHEKALLEATLFGLPMQSLDLPGQRLIPSGTVPQVGTPQSYTSAPGQPPSPGEVLGLRFADFSVLSTLTRHQLVLNNAGRGAGDPAKVTGTWYTGGNGKVSNPAEPVLPLEIRNVDVPNLPLRGIGFRAGDYIDEADVVPLTGAATTEIRGVHAAFPSDIFYPPVFWRPNYFGDLCTLADGGTRLLLTPVQVRTPTGQDTGVIRRFPRTDFRLFYSANITTYVDPANGTTSTPALSGPPSLSNIKAWSEAGAIQFRFQVVGNPAAGIQGVWVTYTAVQGPWHGRWQSLDLVQNADDSRLWEGALPLGGTAPGDVRFVAQAVNGVGLVAFAANLGEFYTPDKTEEPPPPAAAARVEWVSPPASAPYGSLVTLQARLTGNGQALADRIVVFTLGGLEARALTDSTGLAQLTFNLLQPPGPQTLRVVYAGGADFGADDDEATVEVGKAPTRLDLNPTAAVVAPGAASTVEAVLSAGDNPLSEQTVIFIVSGPAGDRVRTAITDFTGHADLGSLDLPPGDYEVEASFAEVVAPPAPYDVLGSTHPLYEGSSATGTLSLNRDVPVAADDLVTERLPLAPKIAIAELLANDVDPLGGELTLADVDSQTLRGVKITRSGPWLLLEQLPAETTSDAFSYRVGNASGLTAPAQVVVRLQPDTSPSSNILGIDMLQDGIRIRFAGIPGRTYQVQFSPPGSTFEWMTLGTATVRSDGTGEFLAPLLDSGGFFRTAAP